MTGFGAGGAEVPSVGQRPDGDPLGAVTRQDGPVGGYWECQWCGQDFPPQLRDRKYCSRRCQNRAYNHAHPVARQRTLDFVAPPPPAPDPARLERERALLKVTRERFMRLALALIEEIPPGWRGTGEDIRLHMEGQGVRAHDPHAWGALVMSALRRRLLRDTGETTHMREKRSHARRTQVLERVR